MTEHAHKIGREWIVGIPDIAKMANVPAQTVYTWRYRGVLPEPDAVVASVPLWRVHRVTRWLEQTGRMPEGNR